jgi:prepilin-type N-terminal cleavage/methylation domain-containing protein
MKTVVPRSLSRARGFTLLEMVIALSIMLLLFAAAFEIMTGVFQSSSTLQDNQNHRDEIVALGAYLKNKLGGMSVQSVFISYRRGDGEGLVQNGIVLGDADMATAIDAKVQPNGFYTLRLVTVSFDSLLKEYATFTAKPAINTAGMTQDQQTNLVASTLTQLVTQDDPSLQWVPLIRDVQHLDWTFQEYNVTKWDIYWPGPGKPNLVQLTLQLAGDLRPDTMDVWIPSLVPVSLAAPQTTTPPTNAH